MLKEQKLRDRKVGGLECRGREGLGYSRGVKKVRTGEQGLHKPR